MVWVGAEDSVVFRHCLVETTGALEGTRPVVSSTDVERPTSQELIVGCDRLFMLPEQREAIAAAIERAEMRRRHGQHLIEASERVAVMTLRRESKAAFKIPCGAIIAQPDRERRLLPHAGRLARQLDDW